VRLGFNRSPVRVMLLGLYGLLSGCIPVAGPDSGSIGSNASAYVNSGYIGVDYALVEMSHITPSDVPELPPGSLQPTLGLPRGTKPATKIGTGDVLVITIFESAAGGLFIPNDAGARPGNFVQLPQQAVDSTGSIAIPYAGSVQVSGMTIDEIQKAIEKRLETRAIEPKVVVNLVSQRATDMVVLGDVRAANKIAIHPAGDRVLDAIAKAGGLVGQGYDYYVSLTRGNNTKSIYFPALVKNAKENIYVEPDDTIYVEKRPRTFIALGATTQLGSANSTGNAVIPFDAERLSLADAVGRVGGLADSRADRKQVFLYRYEDRSVLQGIGVDVSQFASGLDKIPTIYRADFSDSAIFFKVQDFAMRDKDVIYVANAGAVDYLKYLAVLSQTTANYTAIKTAPPP